MKEMPEGTHLGQVINGDSAALSFFVNNGNRERHQGHARHIANHTTADNLR